MHANRLEIFIHQLVVVKKSTYRNIQRNTTNKKVKKRKTKKKQKAVINCSWHNVITYNNIQSINQSEIFRVAKLA